MEIYSGEHIGNLILAFIPSQGVSFYAHKKITNFKGDLMGFITAD